MLRTLLRLLIIIIYYKLLYRVLIYERIRFSL